MGGPKGHLQPTRDCRSEVEHPIAATTWWHMQKYRFGIAPTALIYVLAKAGSFEILQMNVAHLAKQVSGTWNRFLVAYGQVFLWPQLNSTEEMASCVAGGPNRANSFVLPLAR